MCRKSGTHGCEAEVERAIPPSTVTGSTSPSASMWPPWDGGSAHSARARTACGSSSPCTRRIIISASRTPPCASHYRSPYPPMARDRPSSGAPAHRRWRRGSLTMSGPSGRCSYSACRRGRSQWRCEQAGWWEAARGGGLSSRHASTRPASRASPGVRGLLGGHESPLDEAFLPL